MQPTRIIEDSRRQRTSLSVICIAIFAMGVVAALGFLYALFRKPCNLATLVLDHPTVFKRLSLFESLQMITYMLFFLCMLIALTVLIAYIYRWLIERIRFPVIGYTIHCIVLIGLLIPILTRIIAKENISIIWSIPLVGLACLQGYLWYRMQKDNDQKRSRGFAVLAFVGFLGFLCFFQFFSERAFFFMEEQDFRLALCIAVLWAYTALTAFRASSMTMCYIKDSCSRRVCSIGRYALLLLMGAIALTSCFNIYYEHWKIDAEFERAFEKQITGRASHDNMNVILIVIDALRADHLGCYGYERNTSPHLDAFARRYTQFNYCYTSSTWTKPSCVSLLTSLYPRMHGTTWTGDSLSDDLVTLPELMREQGFITYAYISNPNLKGIFNFDQGFDYFDDFPLRNMIYAAAIRSTPIFLHLIRCLFGWGFYWGDSDNCHIANKRILPWLRQHAASQPLFMYLHYMDPHYPYSPPAQYARMFTPREQTREERYMARYDGEIRYVDRALQELFGELRRLGLYDNTLLIVTADHGEEFGEHGLIGHAGGVYQELVHVPLLVKLPRQATPLVIHQPVQLLDIMPTILELTDVSSPSAMYGTSMASLLRSDATGALHDVIFLEKRYDLGNIVFDFAGLLQSNRWKYITNYAPDDIVAERGREELYDIVADPFETNNLIFTMRDKVQAYRKLLSEHVRFCKEHEIVAPIEVLDYETIQQLKALGYVQ